MSLTIGIGNPVYSLSNLHKSYNNALESTSYRIVYNHGAIIFASDIKHSHTNEFTLSELNIQSVLDSLKSTQPDELEKNFKSIIEYIKKCSYKNIQFAISHLTSSIFTTLNSLEKNNIFVFDIHYKDFTEKINSLETIDEIESEFIDLFRHVFKKVLDGKDNKSAIIVQNIIKYIHVNYMDVNLSINSIATNFNMTPTYLGKIFRDYTFQSISAYINEYRLTKAAELLLTTDYTIDEIIDKLNWSNKKYFFVLFKKQFGATPTQYRLKNCVENI